MASLVPGSATRLGTTGYGMKIEVPETPPFRVFERCGLNFIRRELLASIAEGSSIA